MQIRAHVNLKGQESMKIAGLLKTSLLDYPGKLCASAYLSGCNLHCPFCQNSQLAKDPALEAFSREEILDFLKKRRPILEGVCISGGEPALNPDLPDFLQQIKALDYSVKLDTNGTCPHMLSDLIREGLIDYAAMDIKGTPEKYPLICGMDPSAFSMEPIFRSVEALHTQQRIPYEFRTTVVKEFHTAGDFHEICRWIAPAPLYALQLFRRTDTVFDQRLHPWDAGHMRQFLDLCLTYIPGSILRGID